MYICLCDDVKISEIEKIISSDIKDPEEIFKMMNVSTGCGACRETILEFINEKMKLT
jgi:bacterioferritin-associated ferredoxin